MDIDSRIKCHIWYYPSTKPYLQQFGDAVISMLKDKGYDSTESSTLTNICIVFGAHVCNKYPSITLYPSNIIVNLEQMYFTSPWLSSKYLSILSTHSV